jgi:3-hydroxyisobutyrate dehydrogenase-like beta-hydroxyacid dehydrogenase
VAINTYALCLAYALTERSGIDKGLMFDALTGGAADGRLLRLEWPLLLTDDISTGFAVEHMLKDIDLVRPLLTESNLPVDVLLAVQAEFERTATTLGRNSATQALALQILNTITSRQPSEEKMFHD